MRWTGTLEREDLGPGLWVLVTTDGRRYQLDGDIPRKLEGQSVVVRGRAQGGMGIGMLGSPTIAVQSIRRAD